MVNMSFGLNLHPCFSKEAHYKYGRIHLPVSPKCNIQCKFCQRSINKWEKRPGVSRALLTPEQALTVVEKALDLCPEITVVGIAGPGDTLATNHALRTFQLIHQKYPHLIKCLSTNGLLIQEKALEIIQTGVKAVTITVNAVDESILEKICAGIIYNGEYLSGQIGARKLINAQLAGIKKLSEFGVMIKVNTVLIPGINDHHIQEIAQAVRKAGANLLNIIPLIPQFELADRRKPSCGELSRARRGAEKYIPVFKHCQRCRADACGIPGIGKDISHLLYDEPVVASPTFSHG